MNLKSVQFVLLLLFAFGSKFVSGQQEHIVFHLPGFSDQSGLRVGHSSPPASDQHQGGHIFSELSDQQKVKVDNSSEEASDLKTTDENVQKFEAKSEEKILFKSSKPGNNSEFTLCLRFKAHFQRPEYVLVSGFVGNKTSFVFGVDELLEETYFKYSISPLTHEMGIAVFNWIPRIETWEFVCVAKKPEKGKKLSQIKFFVNGEPKGQESSVTADLDGLTSLLLGQTLPATSYEAFSGEVAHFSLWDKSIPRKGLLNMYNCQFEDEPSQDEMSLHLKSDNWATMRDDKEKKNLPIGMILDESEICPQKERDEKLFILTMYHKDEKKHHKEICEEIGGSVPDLVNFGQNGTEKRIDFLRQVYFSARMPNLLDSSIQTSDKINSCFDEDDFVAWIENSDTATKPPLANGRHAGAPLFPIDPNTGKPIGFLPPGINVAFVGGAGAKKKKKKEPKIACALHVKADGTAVKKCENDKMACSVCLLDKQRPTLKLRGLCEESILKKHRNSDDKNEGAEELDTDFFARNDKMSGDVFFRGRLGSLIKRKEEGDDLSGANKGMRYERRHSEWILKSLVSESTATISKVSITKFPVGRNSWEMSIDTCKADEDGSKTLSLTTCKRNEFTCNPGKCLPINYRCDGYDDCEDGEDEENCSVLEIKDGYKSQVGPRHIHKGVPWPIYISVDIVSFPEIMAIEQRITVDFYLTLRWFDPRLEFKNLHQGKQENPIDPATVDQLWIPRLGLLNGLAEFLTVVTEEDAEFFRGYIWRKRDPKPNDLTDAVEEELYKGSLNPIILAREYYHQFTCDFDLTWYPFDRQVCFMNFTVQGQTSKSLILREDSSNHEINYYGKKYLVEYRVETQRLTVPRVPNGNFSTATVELVFQRRVVYHLLNIFLQSLLLILTGYMSLFFHVNNFSDRVMVALTVMLVMASLQSSIQDSLPKTAYFKLIDWWILFSLNTQIGLMTFHTFLGFYTAKEHRNYKENMINGNRNRAAMPKELESNGTNSFMTNSVISSTSFDPDEIIPSEEYDYPKSKRLNTLCNIVFVGALVAFNVVYWSVALGVYFS